MEGGESNALLDFSGNSVGVATGGYSDMACNRRYMMETAHLSLTEMISQCGRYLPHLFFLHQNGLGETKTAIWLAKYNFR